MTARETAPAARTLEARMAADIPGEWLVESTLPDTAWTVKRARRSAPKRGLV